MSKPRILIIENSIAVTGALQSAIRAAQALSNQFHFSFVLPTSSSAVKLIRSLNLDVYELPMHEIRKNLWAILRYLPSLIANTKRLTKIIHKLGIDLVVINDFYNLLAPAYKMSGGKAPYVCFVRFLPSKFPRALVKCWCALHHRYADTVIAVSAAVKKELSYAKDVMVVGNELPHDEIEFSPQPIATIILYPANYIRGKGQEYALQSWAIVSKKHPHWKLRFVGGDMGLAKNKQFKKDLIQLCQKLQIDNSVEWGNFADLMSEEYLRASFVLNFSESESFSMTCLEAMFYGRPVIATRSGGPSEIIEHDTSGILVNLRDVDAMATAIEYLITNPDKRETMARNAFESVRIKFSFANTIERVGKVFREALEKSSTPIV